MKSAGRINTSYPAGSGTIGRNSMQHRTVGPAGSVCIQRCWARWFSYSVSFSCFFRRAFRCCWVLLSQILLDFQLHFTLGCFEPFCSFSTKRFLENQRANFLVPLRYRCHTPPSHSFLDERASINTTTVHSQSPTVQRIPKM